MTKSLNISIVTLALEYLVAKLQNQSKLHWTTVTSAWVYRQNNNKKHMYIKKTQREW